MSADQRTRIAIRERSNITISHDASRGERRFAQTVRLPSHGEGGSAKSSYSFYIGKKSL